MYRDMLDNPELCETPKSPPGDYKRGGNARARGVALVEQCETPKSPPGDYKAEAQCWLERVMLEAACETPKSPPGDYKRIVRTSSTSSATGGGVKHLNPRQGITRTPVCASTSAA